MMGDPKLPPLPEPHHAEWGTGLDYYTADQMHAYAAQARADALEEAARLCYDGAKAAPDLMTAGVAFWLAATIRALASHSGGGR